MSINKTITLNWFDESYKLKVTMGLIDRIEEELNPLVMAGECQSGDIKLGKAAKLFTILLNEAGKDITREEVHQDLFNCFADLTGLRDMLIAVFTAIFPEPKKKSVKKNSSDTKAKPKKVVKKKATRGKSSTK